MNIRYAIVLLFALEGLALGQEPKVELAAKARDILQQHCFDCHGKDPAKVRGDLNIFEPKHLLDKERKIVVAGLPEQSDLVKQVEKGTMPPGKRPKVPEADRRVLRDSVTAGAPTPGNVLVIPEVPTQSPAQLAARAKEVFRAHCLDCHGGTRTTAGVRVLDHALLLKKKKIVPGKPADSLLLKLMTASDDTVMPPQGQPPVPSGDIDAVRQWVQQGAAAFPDDITPPTEPARDKALANVTGIHYVLKHILEDVRALPAKERPFARYFSVNHILSAGATATELEAQRQALAKAINHLSWQRDLVVPRAIDGQVGSIFHVDIRDLGWDQQPLEEIRDGKAAGPSKYNLFDLVLLDYPYGVIYDNSETYDQLLEQYLVPAGLVRPIPYVRSDWFVSTVTQPPLYEDLLRLPFEIGQLESRLDVSCRANLENGKAVRAGMTVSGVSRNNRVVERHPTGHGAYWKSHDFRSSKGVENIFRNPLDFQPSGGEMIFNLPNGLQGYFVTNARRPHRGGPDRDRHRQVRGGQNRPQRLVVYPLPRRRDKDFPRRHAGRPGPLAGQHPHRPAARPGTLRARGEHGPSGAAGRRSLPERHEETAGQGAGAGAGHAGVATLPGRSLADVVRRRRTGTDRSEVAGTSREAAGVGRARTQHARS